jgi:hypothetical protein
LARYRGTIESRWPQEKAFAYMADFSKVPEWDDSFESAERLSSDPLQKGARFILHGKALGRTVDFDYETIEIDAPRRVTLRTETGAIISLDKISVTSRPGGSLVEYDADLQAKGPLRLFDPLLSLWFRRIGNRAKAGLERELNK